MIFLYILLAFFIFVIVYGIRGWYRMKRYEKRFGLKLDISKDIQEQAKQHQKEVSVKYKKKLKNIKYMDKLKRNSKIYGK